MLACIMVGSLVGGVGARQLNGSEQEQEPTEEPPPSDLESGDLVNDHGAAALVPLPGKAVHVEAIYPRGRISEELTISTSLNGEVSLVGWGSEADGESSPNPDGPINPTDNGCSDNTYNLKPWKVYTQFEWRFNASPLPTGLTQTEAETALKDGAKNIVLANNDCGLTDNITGTQQYLGTTADGVNINTVPQCGVADGKSIVRFGPMSNYLAVACTWTDTTPNPDKVTSSDVKFNTNYAWETDVVRCISEGSVAYMVEDVMTHEQGHTFGLAHVGETSHEWLTMSTNSQGPCDESQSTIGLGDYNGLNVRY